MKRGMILALALAIFALMCVPATAWALEGYVFPATLTEKAFDTLNFESVNQDDDSRALYAAMTLRDGGEGLAGFGVDVGSLERICVCNQMLDYPSLLLFEGSNVFLVSYMKNNGNTVYLFDSATPASKRDAFLDTMGGVVFKEPTDVDMALCERYRTAELSELNIVTAEAAQASGGDASLFHNADRVFPAGLGWFAYKMDDVAGFIRPDGTAMGGYNDVWAFRPKSGLTVAYLGAFGAYGTYEKDADDHYTGTCLLIDGQGNELERLERGFMDTWGSGDEILNFKAYDGSQRLYDLEARAFIPLDGDYTDFSRPSDGMIAVGLVPEGAEKTLWGAADRSGKTVIAPKYEAALRFAGGLAVTKLDGKYGVIDAQGNAVIPFTWDSVEILGNGQITAERDEKSYLLDEKGMVQCELGEVTCSWYAGDYYTVYDWNASPAGCGLIDLEGNAVLEIAWYDVRMLDETHARVAVKEGDEARYGVVDVTTGETVLPIQFSAISGEIEDGLRAFGQLGYMGYLDADYNLVIPPQYEDATRFQDGYAAVKDGSGWHIIDTEGNIML